MVEITIISLVTAVVLGVLLWDRHTEKSRLSDEIKGLKESNQELLKRIPIVNEGSFDKESLTVDKIADAIRFEGFFPEVENNLVMFRVQGKVYYVDTTRLPLLFVVKPFEIDPNELEIDLFKAAAHSMSDQLVMVKASISDDEKRMRYFIATRDRNYESFRANLTVYMRLLDDGQYMMNETYNQLVQEKHKTALESRPIVPLVKQGSKVMS
jgi:hypothetical protein